jgi:GTP-binding protein
MTWRKYGEKSRHLTTLRRLMATPTPTTKEVRISEAEFTAGAQKPEQIPPPKGPEIAFAGRSNVGKSSLLNMMLARKGLARTSRTPGCTRQINFFDIAVAGGPKLVFVDLPGYGYAKVSKAESRDWKQLLEGYLQERPTLEAVVVLVDARRGVEQEEQDLVEFLGLRKGLPVFVAVTKLDKLSKSEQKPRLQQIEKESGVKVVGTSAETGAGREELWNRLLRVTTHRLDDRESAKLV